MLAIDDAAAPAQAALASIHAVLGNDPQARAFANLWHLVGSVASGLERLPASQRVQPRYALSVAWNATGLAPVWQRAALFNTAEGRTANDRLDAAMRLFQFADDSTASRDITSFMAQVRGMEVQADSSAEAALKENQDFANTFGQLLTTPDYNTAFMDLEQGAVDAVAMDVIVAGYQIKQRNADFKILDDSLSEEEYGVGFKKGNTELRDKVQGALEEMAADGTLAKISDEWFGEDVTTIGK